VGHIVPKPLHLALDAKSTREPHRPTLRRHPAQHDRKDGACTTSPRSLGPHASVNGQRPYHVETNEKLLSPLRRPRGRRQIHVQPRFEADVRFFDSCTDQWHMMSISTFFRKHWHVT